MKEATFVKALEGFTGDARLFRCDPPLSDYDEEGGSWEYVIVSATVAMIGGPETYIFPATKDGEIAEWGELPGSFKGGLNHSEALENAGYTVKE